MRARYLIQRRPAIIFRQGGVGVMRLSVAAVFDHVVEFSLEAPLQLPIPRLSRIGACDRWNLSWVKPATLSVK
jgi:hypothetical protein